MAAVIWGAPENINKDATDILNMMIENSTYPYSKDTEYGHGVIDLLQILDVNCEPLEYPCDTDEEDPCATKVCPEGQNCVNGTCIPDVINCGDVPCPVGYDCVNGICIPKDGNGIECINGMCPQDMKCVNGVCIF